jgi:ribosomal protein S4
MLLKKKNRFKPVFKQLLLLRENVRNNKKFLKFKRKKWEKLLSFYKRKLKKYKKFKPQDQTQYTVTKYANKGTAYNKRYQSTFHSVKRFNFLYGGFSKKYIKKKIKFVFKQNKNRLEVNTLFLRLFEVRLDSILYKAKFCTSPRSARQLIVHGAVFVNDRAVKNKNYELKQGDLIAVNPKYTHLIENNIRQIQAWPVPPKHLIINYKTMQILVGNIDNTNSNIDLTFSLQLEKVILNYLKH